MRKILAIAAFALPILLQGCSSLPDGARRPALEIERVTISGQGYGVDFTIRHSSPEPLQAEGVRITITGSNGRELGTLHDSTAFEIPPRREMRLRRVVQSGEGATARASLATPMLTLGVSASLKVEIAGAAGIDGFEPVATYSGVAAHE
ncbi:MAG: hypothetical protein K6A65_02045 [Succinivibrionaceae bacterium]|nr:hypothetical protein [Succinivibrionaceae bacterium]